MKRLYPRHLTDPVLLSRLLAAYLNLLEQCPLQVTLRRLAHETRIPETVWERLLRVHQSESPDPAVTAADYYIVFSNMMFRYPTVKIWECGDGGWVFEY